MTGQAGHGNVLVRDEPVASIIQEAFEGMASGRFQSQAEVARFFQSQPDFPKPPNGKVTIQAVSRIFSRPIYGGMVERPEWNVSLRPGKHEGLVSFETYEKVQERLQGRAYAPARADVNADFPLRGAVACDDCGHPMTACWSKSKTGARHPYYMCFHKGCDSYRKSIRRDKVEGEFEVLLDSLRPAEPMLNIARTMFSDAWEQQRRHTKATLITVKRGIAETEKEIAKLVDRIVGTSSEAVVSAYESQIEKLERQKLVLAENLQNGGQPERPFREMFELSLEFLSNPCNLWKSPLLEDKKTAIRLVFSDRLRYCRNQGFRTPKTSIIFKALEGINTGNFKMAERRGFEPRTPFGEHDFQSCALSRSAISPREAAT